MRVKITDTEADAFTFCRSDEVGGVLRLWFQHDRAVMDAIDALQDKLSRGEYTGEEETFLAVRIEVE